MKTLQQIETDIRKLSPEEQEQLCDWLAGLLEERSELKEDFKAEIEIARKDLVEGRYRIRTP